ncbi:MAG: redox-regulated ATPase YchF [Bacteroidales bacterium]|mgnify:CR=1 FL=1|nr:redox-regulated ATPase YchF [Bacteroidales bacterium]
MALKVGIIGLTNCGKTTIFNCMSDTKAEVSTFAFSTTKSNLGTAQVFDPRLYELDKLIKAEKVVPASIEIVDIPGLAKGAGQGEGIGNSFLNDIRNVDALIHVVRCFDDPLLPHIDGSIDPLRDKETLDFELQVKDLEQIDRKLQKVEKALKSGDKAVKPTFDSLTKFKTHLENFGNIRSLELNEEDLKLIRELFLLTAKPVMYVCNVDDNSAKDGNKYSSNFIEETKKENTEIIIIAGRTEAEIAELDENDRRDFLNDLGLSEPSIHRISRAAYSLLNLISFFTVGGVENRAWSIKRDTPAPQAAGAIHSDLERGFIRAEVIAYNDMMQYKSEAACKDAGKMRVEGKSYIVQDGDILHIRFNV